MIKIKFFNALFLIFLFCSAFAQNEMYQSSIFKADSISIILLSEINSNNNDYSTWVDGNFMFFTSTRNPGWSVKYPETKKGYENIFYSIKKDSVWSLPSTKPLSSRKTDYAVAGMSDNSNIIIVYDGRFGGGELFLHNIKDTVTKWGKQKTIFDNMFAETRKTSAFLNEKTGELFFTSNIEGHTIGGKDIYIARKLENNKWGKPENIGKIINSANDEEGLFLYNDTLYFSSKGHQSNGKYDIYYSVRTNNNWSEPIKLPPPINSEDNDIFFVLKGNKFYLSSDREEEMLNIYEGELIKIQEIIEEEIIEVEEEVVEEEEIVKDTISRQFTAREKNFIDILKEIPEEILHYRVQLGAFRLIKSIDDYKNNYPQVEETIIMEPVDKDVSRFLIDKVYYADEPDAILNVTNMQEKVIKEYEITDSFIAAYTKEGKRIVIIWDINNNKFKILLN